MTRSSAKRLIVFNHKGGVGKTTLGINIATKVGDLGKKVMLVAVVS
jgi:cellulose biosynthesis protein BcsQ